MHGRIGKTNKLLAENNRALNQLPEWKLSYTNIDDAKVVGPTQ